MKRDFRRFAPIGLYVAIAAAIVAAALAIIQRSFSLPIQISLAVMVIGLAAFILIDPEKTRQALTGRQARYGSNALIMSLAFIGILVAINFLISSHSIQWDLTEDKQNSLAKESIEALNSLKSNVKADAFYSSQMASSATTAEDVLRSFKTKSNGKFDYQFIDPETNPIQAQQEKVTRDGTIVLKMDDRQEQITYASEEDITGALIRLSNPGKRAVYFLTGHGEYDLDSSAENNYSQVKTSLTAKNYTVNPLNLLAAPKIPDDALALIIPGPTKPLSQNEVDLIKAYQEKGGALIYLAEPRPVTDFGEQADPMMDYLNKTWGISLDEDMVIDPNSTQPLVAISQKFGNSTITQKMNSLAIVLPSARTVRAADTPPANVTLTPLAYSSDLAWGETDINSIKQNKVQKDAGKDLLGPVTLAISGENTTTKARVIVVGDSDFAGNKGFANYGNSDFIMNSIDWAAAQENLISLTPRQSIQRILVPPQQYTMGLIFFSSVFLLPGLIIAMGVITWIQRRSRG